MSSDLKLLTIYIIKSKLFDFRVFSTYWLHHSKDKIIFNHLKINKILFLTDHFIFQLF